MSAQIVVVEDELQIAQLLIDYLQANQYQVQHFATGEGVVEWINSHEVGCVLLDVMLPDSEKFGDGLQLCRQIREGSSVPIMMLTARVEEIDRILGLELGADDYVCKPFSPREVVARVKALLRRSQTSSEVLQQKASVWYLDEGRYRVHYHEQSTELSAVEFAMMRALSSAHGSILSRSQLIDVIYQDNRIVSDRTVDSHVKKLRQKLHAAFGEVEWVQSVYGVGYRFVLEE